ncbi:Neurotrypsin [Aphelenchoides avenae]|nr:Neurotrypsin [Aphelenchus avenae]
MLAYVSVAILVIFPLALASECQESPDFQVGYKPHPADCAKFYQCAHGSWVEKQCGPGTAYNPNVGVCDWPYNVPGCDGSVKTTKATKKPTTKRPTTVKPTKSTKAATSPTTTAAAAGTTTKVCSVFLKAVCGNLLYARDGSGPFAVCSAIGNDTIYGFYQNECLPQICSEGKTAQCEVYGRFATLCQEKLPAGSTLDDAWRTTYGCVAAAPSSGGDPAGIQVVQEAAVQAQEAAGAASAK